MDFNIVPKMSEILLYRGFSGVGFHDRLEAVRVRPRVRSAMASAATTVKVAWHTDCATMSNRRHSLVVHAVVLIVSDCWTARNLDRMRHAPFIDHEPVPT